MSKIRVYELAKELGLDNKALIVLCEQLGMEDKGSHSNSLSDEEADRIRRYVIRRAVNEKASGIREVTREGHLVTERRVGGSVIRRRKKTDEEEAEEADAEQHPQIDLNEVIRERELPTLAPDLAGERRARNEALERADALFKKPNPAEETAEPDDAEEEVEDVAHENGTALLRTEPAAFESEEVEEDEEEEEEQVEDEEEEEQEEVVDEPQVEAVANEVPELVEEIDDEAVQAAAAAAAAAGDIAARDRLNEVRKRLDIRAPKVLGKISLPAKVVPQKKVEPEKPQTGGATAQPDTTESGRSKSKKRKSHTIATPAAREDDDFNSKRKPKKKTILSKKELVDYDGERDGWKTKRDRKGKRKQDRNSGEQQQIGGSNRLVKIDGQISVGEFARQMGLKAAEVISHLMNVGTMAGINQLIDFETATVVAEELGFKTINTEEDVEGLIGTMTEQDDPSLLKLRPPIVTVMGHVDHGKTSLLDCIRKTSVTTGEFGGITQHIGAYNVKLATGGSVTFLDTPGHEAFTAMRMRGAQVTDIVVLVVAADDGVMPQTIEAINHAKAANVPIIVAINKIDKEGANPDKVINQLSEYGLVPEDWGGDTLMVRVSAHTKEGVETLLENLHLQAELLELRANSSRRAMGRVVEARIDKGRGPVITVLVQNGTLKKGDAFIAGPISGKVRALVADDGTPVDEAGPSIPVEVLGVAGAATSGDDFVVFETEIEARRIADERALRLRKKQFANQKLGVAAGGPLTLERFSAMVNDSTDMKELPLIVKGDVQGSVEAVTESLADLSNDEVRVRIIHKGVGAITENDIQLASASQAVVVAFNVRPDVRASSLIEQEGVEMLYSRVIYDLVDSVQAALKGRMTPKFHEKTLGHVEVRQTFKVPKLGTIAGSYVTDGTISRSNQVRLLRDGVVMFEGKMASLKRFKEDVREVATGYECGIGLEGYADIKDGDVIEVYKVEEVTA